MSNKKYKQNNKQEIKSFISRTGINSENNKYWREDNYKTGITIIYDNVKETDVMKFNEILDFVIIRE